MRNEADILELNLDWYHRAGFRTVVVDNDSDDGSYEICAAALEAGVIEALKRVTTDGHQLHRLLAELVELAGAQEPDYLLLTNADEFFETADGADLRRAMEEDFAAGFNLLKFYNMEFWMTVEDDPTEPNPLARMRHYSLHDYDMYRAYPFIAGIDLATHGGHRPVFPSGVEERESPRRYISRHYKLRNVAQAKRKIKRIRPTPENPDGHHHYLIYSGDAADFYVSPSRLFYYDEDQKWRYEQKELPWRLGETAIALSHERLRRERLEAAHAELGHQYAELGRQHRELWRREAALRGELDDLGSRRALLVTVDDAVKRAERAVAAHAQAVAERDRVREMRDEHERTIAELRRDIDAERAEVRRLQGVMESVWRSLSWRITAPLRGLRRRSGTRAQATPPPDGEARPAGTS